MSKIPKGYIEDKITKEILLQFPTCSVRSEKVRVCCHGLKSKIQYCDKYKHQVIRECAKCTERV